MTVAAFQQRRGAGETLAERLAAEGLLGRGREGASDPLEFAHRLVRALSGAAPAHRAFLPWLAGRVDLLPASACRMLWAVRGPRSRTPSVTMAAGTGSSVKPSEEELAVADDLRLKVVGKSLVCGPFRRTFRATTAAGRLVDLTLVRREATLEVEPGGLAPLGTALDAAGLPGEELISAYRHTALMELDLEREAEALAELETDAAAFPSLWVPTVLEVNGDPHAYPGFLIREVSPGIPLSAAAVPSEAFQKAAATWLRQVVEGRAFPLRPAGFGVRWLPQGAVAYVEGPFTSLPANSRNQLWEYLVAAVSSDPRTVRDHLLPELVRLPDGAGSEEDLLLRLRQVVPFRDGTLGEGVDPLADEMFATLRLARECGYGPRRPLGDLVSSAFDLAAAALEWAPGEEPVRRAVLDLRMECSVRELYRQWSPAGMTDLPAPYLQILLDLPRKLDAALELLERGEARVRLERPPPAAPAPSHRDRFFVLATLLMVALLLAPRMTELGGEGGTLLTIGAAAFLLGALLGKP